MKRILSLASLALMALAQEPSAFEAGNLNAPNPYGLTPQERAIYQNKKDIKQIKTRLYTLQSEVQNLKERISGIESLVEGIDQSLNQMRHERQSEQNETSISSQTIATLQKDLNTSIAIQKENYAKIRRILKELTSMVDHINSTYVSRAELKKALEKIYAFIGRKQLSGRELFLRARAAYKKHHFKEAKEYFTAAIQKRYKPATSHFYIGESCYYMHDYACAVVHYKKSATLYAKSSFMPTLLLHTAISLERLGKEEEAQKFYHTLLRLYPHSKAAAIAKKRVKK